MCTEEECLDAAKRYNLIPDLPAIRLLLRAGFEIQGMPNKAASQVVIRWKGGLHIVLGNSAADAWAQTLKLPVVIAAMQLN